MRHTLLAAFVALAFAIVPSMSSAQDAKPEDTIVMQLKDGEVRIRLRPDIAPQHAERIRTLANQGFYDGLKFHRVMEGFMAQTGDPRGDGSGGSDLPDLPAEFSDVPYKRGIVGMARTPDPNSANSQFFIMFDEADFLNGQYTVIGEVTSGMEVVDKIKRGDLNRNGAVDDPDSIVKMRTADKMDS